MNKKYALIYAVNKIIISEVTIDSKYKYKTYNKSYIRLLTTYCIDTIK